MDLSWIEFSTCLFDGGNISAPVSLSSSCLFLCSESQHFWGSYLLLQLLKELYWHSKSYIKKLQSVSWKKSGTLKCLTPLTKHEAHLRKYHSFKGLEQNTCWKEFFLLLIELFPVLFCSQYTVSYKLTISVVNPITFNSIFQ